MNASSTILVGWVGKIFWLRVEGRGTFQNSVQVKSALQRVIEEGAQDLVVDLGECPIMDSTFLGTLTGAALNLRQKRHGALTILNANPRNLQLLSDLGLDHIMSVDAAGTAWPEERRAAAASLGDCRDRADASKEEQTRHVLKAHETLASVSAANECRFQDVIHFLTRELQA